MKLRSRRSVQDDQASGSSSSSSTAASTLEAHPDLLAVVERGDTLSGMAADMEGDWRSWTDLHELNRDKVRDPDRINVGQGLEFPEAWRPGAQPRPRLRRQRLRPGDRGDAVRDMQVLLDAAGQDVSVDGRFDGSTTEAVQAYQEEVGQAPDAQVGTNVADALDEGRTSAPAEGSWTVEEGESLGSIAERFTGDWGRYPELWVANQDRVPDPDKLEKGTVLVLPDTWSAASAPAEVAAPSEGQAEDTDGLLTVERGQLTFDAEGQEGGAYHSRTAHWPGGASGVTIGRGYDMRERSWKEVHDALVGAGVPEQDAIALADGAGLSGTEARDFIRDADLPEISLEAQKVLFDETYAWYVADVQRISQLGGVVSAYGEVDFETLDPALLDLAVDLRYRGDYTRVTRQVVQPLLVANDVEGMARVMANKGLWLGVPEDRFLRRKKWMEEALLHGTPSAPAAEGAEGLGKPSVDVGDADPKGVLSDAWLNPQVRAIAARTVEAMQKDGLEPYISEGYRSFARQDELYAKGGVTKARGGQSWHNYGLAVDIVFWNSSHNGPSWDEGFDWDKVGQYGKAAGFTEWGGDWGWDRPHLEYHPGFEGRPGDLAPLYHADGLGAVWRELGVVSDGEEVELVVSDRYGWAAVEGGSLVLRRDSRGEAVRELQERLKAAGHDLKVDGSFGRGTEDTVKAFQEDQGLDPDGVVGKETAALLPDP